MVNKLKKTMLATAAGVAALVGGHAAASADTVEVKAGDTLSGIAQANNTTVDALAKINNISNPNLIIAGESLTVTDTKPAAISADGTTYTVQAGDSLSKVAEYTGVNVATLKMLNGLSTTDLIITGQTLSLKATATTPTAATVTATQQAPEENLTYIAAADTNRDGFMSLDEYNTFKANGGDINQSTSNSATTVTIPDDVKYIAAADTNKDGFMSAAEYLAYRANGGAESQAVPQTQAAPQTQAVPQTQAAPQTQAVPQTQAASSAVQTLLNTLNAKRSALGLAPVRLDAGLSARAQARAQNAVDNGGLPTNHFNTSGEVVAIRFSPETVIDAWYNETNMITNGVPAHRMWVANARATAVGFGIVGDTIVGESN